MSINKLERYYTIVIGDEQNNFSYNALTRGAVLSVIGECLADGAEFTVTCDGWGRNGFVYGTTRVEAEELILEVAI